MKKNIFAICVVAVGCTAQCVSGGLSMDDDIFIAYNAFVQ